MASNKKMGGFGPCDNGTSREAGLAEARATFWRRNRWLMWVGGGLLAALAALAVVAAMVAHRAEPYLRARIVESLQKRFNAPVKLNSFHMSLRNGLDGHWGVWAEGHGLQIWAPVNHPNDESAATGSDTSASTPANADPKPLIQLEEFRFHAPLIYERGKPFQISVVELKGLDVDLPPRSHFEHVSGGPAGTAQTGAALSRSGGELLQFKVNSLECNGARLVLETSKPGKLPVEIAIAHFKLANVGLNKAMSFDAELTNPRPVGTIHTTGNFGPWAGSDSLAGPDLGASPLAGDYRFEHADLSDFKGIAGILSSTGHYEGTLRNLVVDGETDTPDFQLKPFDNPLALHTKFHAKVDGTNGDTWLEPVDATLGHSHFTAQGQVVRVVAAGAGSTEMPQSRGHDIALTVNMDRTRIEDFLALASHGGTPLLTGAVTMKTKLHIPPGSAPVHKRLNLDGTFKLDQAQFSSARIQGDIKQLSLRGQGRPKDVKTTDPASIDSTMEGDFQMAGGVITLPALTYTVPGATIQLNGTYGVEGGALNFLGNAKMDATVSQMVGGWKGLLLTPLDPYFKKNGAGTEIPIHIRGTREQPEFGIDFDRMKGGSAGQPTEKQ